MTPMPFALAGTQRQYERPCPFRMLHLALSLALDPAQRSVSGTARLDFERVDPDASELRLDAVGFEIQSVLLRHGRRRSESPARYEYDGDAITVSVGRSVERGSLLVRYRATPRRGLYFLAPDEDVRDRPVQIWSQCQDEDARHWFPCHDKPHAKLTTELRVEVPPDFVVLSNGELVDSRTPGARGRASSRNASGKATRGSRGPWTYHFRMDYPHPSYLVTLVAGHFDVLEDRPAKLADGRRVPITYLVPVGRREDGQRTFSETPRMVEFFSRVTGLAYPWSRYSQVVVSDFIFGGMENTTATTMYEHILIDQRAALDVTSNDLIAHELAHQWFGDYVTCRDWSHAWLNEGFATFLEHVEREHRLGRDEYEWGLLGDLESYLSEAQERYRRPIVCREYVEPIDLFDRHLYQKGSLVLHMLRQELGEPLFWSAVHKYLEEHALGLVETNDLQRVLEKVSGRSFELFFDQWVYRAGHPELTVKVGWEDGLLLVEVEQTQDASSTPPFAFPFEISVAFGKSVTHHKKTARARIETQTVPCPKRPDWVAFDPELRVLGSVKWEVPVDMLQRQLVAGSTARLRALAAQALGRRDEVTTIHALGRALADARQPWMVRAEAARSLGRIRASEALDWLRSQRSVRHPKVRRAVAGALGEFRCTESAKILSAIIEQDESYMVVAEACRALGSTRQREALEVLLGQLDSDSWADVIRAGALTGLGLLGLKEALPAVRERTHPRYRSRARRAAILALAKLSDEREVRQHLEDLLDDADPSVRMEVVDALLTLGAPRSRSALSRRLEREGDGRVARRLREGLRILVDSALSDQRKMRDDLEAVRRELGELRVRLSKAEQTHGAQTKTAAPRTKARGRRG
jgi:aminopeptidase N